MQKEGEKKSILMSLIFVAFLYQMAVNITLPDFTLLFFDKRSSLLGFSVSHITRSLLFGATNAVFLLGSLVVATFMSAVSDRIGRKKSLIICILSLAVFTSMIGLEIVYSSVFLFMVSYLFYGSFRKIDPILYASIGDIEKNVDKAAIFSGYLQFAFSLGIALSLSLGGYLLDKFGRNKFGFSSPYFIAAVIALILYRISYIYFKETNVTTCRRSNKKYFAKIRLILKNKNIIKLIIITVLFQFTWSLFYQYVAPLIELDFGFSATKIGGFMSAIAVFTMFGSVFGIRWANRTFKKNSLLIFNTFILTVGVLLVIIADLFFRNHFNWLIWIAIIPIATGNIVLYCELAALFMAEANKGLMGITMAIFYFVVNLTWLLTAMVGGIAEAVSPLTPMIVAPVGSIMLLVFLFKATDQKT